MIATSIDAALAGFQRSGPGRPAKAILVPPRCRNCGEVIPRRRSGYGMESPCEYLRRVFCNVGCNIAWNDRTAAKRARPKKPWTPAAPDATRIALYQRLAKGWAGTRRKRRAFDACVLSHVSAVTPRTVGELHQLVTDDWGSASERTTYRAISRHRRAGRIVQTGEGYVRAPARRSA